MLREGGEEPREEEPTPYNSVEDAGPILDVGDTAITENLGIENKEEGAADQAVAEAFVSINQREALASAEWKKKAKEFFETRIGKGVKYTGYGVGIIGGGLVLWFLKDIYFLWKLAKKLVETGGKFNGKIGKELGEELVSPFGGDKKKG